MKIFDDIEKYLKDSVTPGTNAYDDEEEFDRKQEEDASFLPQKRFVIDDDFDDDFDIDAFDDFDDEEF